MRRACRCALHGQPSAREGSYGPTGGRVGDLSALLADAAAVASIAQQVRDRDERDVEQRACEYVGLTPAIPEDVWAHGGTADGAWARTCRRKLSVGRGLSVRGKCPTHDHAHVYAHVYVHSYAQAPAVPEDEPARESREAGHDGACEAHQRGGLAGVADEPTVDADRCHEQQEIGHEDAIRDDCHPELPWLRNDG